MGSDLQFYISFGSTCIYFLTIWSCKVQLGYATMSPCSEECKGETNFNIIKCAINSSPPLEERSMSSLTLRIFFALAIASFGSLAIVCQLCG